jgi:hypothetical protein
VICLARLKAVSRAKPSLFGPGQAGPLVTAQQRLWLGSEYPKAKAGGSGRGFSHVTKFMCTSFLTQTHWTTTAQRCSTISDRCLRLLDSTMTAMKTSKWVSFLSHSFFFTNKLFI